MRCLIGAREDRLKAGSKTSCRFSWGVARNVARENQRDITEIPLEESAGPPVNPVDPTAYEGERMAEIRHRCLQRCLGLLDEGAARTHRRVVPLRQGRKDRI